MESQPNPPKIKTNTYLHAKPTSNITPVTTPNYSKSNTGPQPLSAISDPPPPLANPSNHLGHRINHQLTPQSPPNNIIPHTPQLDGNFIRLAQPFFPSKDLEIKLRFEDTADDLVFIGSVGVERRDGDATVGEGIVELEFGCSGKEVNCCAAEERRGGTFAGTGDAGGGSLDWGDGEGYV